MLENALLCDIENACTLGIPTNCTVMIETVLCSVALRDVSTTENYQRLHQ
jgi:hypothetical protein